MITQPRASKWPGLASAAVLALLCAFGAAAFLYPFFLAGRALNEQSAHAADAPLIFAVLGPALLALLVADLAAGRLNAKTVAVLGMLTAINAVLRLPAGPGDAPTFFFLVIILGATDRRAPSAMAPLAIGLGLTLIHLIGIPVSNLSVNPARSTATAAIVGGWAMEQLWLFWVAPFLGAAVAGLIYPVMAGESKG